MEDTKKLIEKYKRELMELCKGSAGSSGQTVPAKPAETAKSAEPEAPEQETEKPADGILSPKAEAPAPEAGRPDAENAPCGEKKAPQIIGYVSEGNSGFSEIFDKYIIEDECADKEDTPDKDVEADCAEEPPVSDYTPERSDNCAERPDDADLTEIVEIVNGDEEDIVSSSEKLFGEMRGTDEEESGFEQSEFSDYEEFKEHNIGAGTLEFRVFTAEQALPVKSAKITVTVKIGGKNREMFSDSADESGETAPAELPAPSKELSQQPYNRVQPFSLYDAKVECDGYDTVILNDIPVFDGVQSVQRVAMIPSVSETEARNGE